MINIGIIGYLSDENNEGYINIISPENYSKKITFTPSDINFPIDLSQLLVIEENEHIKKYFEFNLNDHSKFLNLKMLKDNNETIDIWSNRKIAKYIIDNDLDENYSPDLVKLRAISKLINYHIAYPPPKVLISNFEELIEEYDIRYIEGGRDKAGDWSKGWITVHTTLPSNLPDYNLDNYLSKLLPEFNFTLGESDDCMEYKFKSDILRKLRNEIGIGNIEKINELCSELTNNIKQFARLLYRENEHALSLWNEYKKLYSDILKKYSL
jgi:hypothetical protein